MELDPLSIALQGVGYDSLRMALQGFVLGQEPEQPTQFLGGGSARRKRRRDNDDDEFLLLTVL